MTREFAASGRGEAYESTRSRRVSFPSRMTEKLLEAAQAQIEAGVPMGRVGGEGELKGVRCSLRRRFGVYYWHTTGRRRRWNNRLEHLGLPVSKVTMKKLGSQSPQFRSSFFPRIGERPNEDYGRRREIRHHATGWNSSRDTARPRSAFNRSARSHGARALIIDNGSEKIALVSVDSSGFRSRNGRSHQKHRPPRLHTSFRPHLRMSSHTHSGAERLWRAASAGECAAGKYDRRFARSTNSAPPRRSFAANKTLKPARIALGAAKLGDLAFQVDVAAQRSSRS